MAKRSSHLVGLDIGTTNVRVVIAEPLDGRLEVVGIGEVESKGLRQGVIADVLPQEYTVDDQDGIGDPLGMLGSRLAVSVHIITSPIAAKQNIITSVNRAGLSVADMMLAQLAAGEAVLTDDDREFGAALVNIGGETTSLAIYQRGAVWHTAVFPVG